MNTNLEHPHVFRKSSFASDVELRFCEESDLLDLEWFGAFWAHRSIIRAAWEKQGTGDNVMLLAIVNGFPVGQIWIDIERYASARGAYFWAFRVMPPFQNHGIGAHLLSEAERFLSARGFLFAVVDSDNRDARRMYERHGYAVLKRWRRKFSFVRPDGETVTGAEWNWEMRKHLSEQLAPVEEIRRVPAAPSAARRPQALRAERAAVSDSSAESGTTG